MRRTRFDRSRALAGTLLVALVGLSGIGGCGPADTAPRRPHVLLVSIDTLRPDHTSVYGYGRETTPTLERLAGEGATFDLAYSTSSWTLPAHASAFTGLSAPEHGVEQDDRALGSDVPTLPEVFAREGYATGGIASHVFVGERYGFDRGFDHFEVRVNQRARRVTRSALDWLAQTGTERPFFLFLHYFDPHWPFDPPPEALRRFTDREVDRTSGLFETLLPYADPSLPLPEHLREDVVDLYDGEIRSTDDALGRVVGSLAARGLLDETIVLVFSDHGEELGERGSFGHGLSLYAETVRIPLILRYPPAVEAGIRIERPVSLRAVAGTILDLAGIDRPATMSAPGLLQAPAPSLRDPLVLATSRIGERRTAIVADGFKFHPPGEATLGIPSADGERQVRLPLPPALFRVETDPDEQRNLGVDHPRAEDLREALGAWMRDLETLDSRSLADPTGEDREALEALGYL